MIRQLPILLLCNLTALGQTGQAIQSSAPVQRAKMIIAPLSMMMPSMVTPPPYQCVDTPAQIAALESNSQYTNDADWLNGCWYWPPQRTQWALAGAVAYQASVDLGIWFDYTGTNVDATQAALMMFRGVNGVMLGWVPSSSGTFIYYGPASHSYTNRIDAGSATNIAMRLPVGTFYIAQINYDANGNLGPYSPECVATVRQSTIMIQ